jgi:Fe-S-cluster containining protein
VAREAMKALGAMCDGWLSKDADRPVACASGCSHCCHQPVSVTPAEAFAIVHYLRQTRSEQDLAVLVERLEQRRAATEGLTRAQQYSPEYPCLFLVEGTCSIYDARPLVCRGMNSLDAEDCRRRMHDPEARQQFWREGGGECYLEPIEGAHAMTAGLQLGLTDVYGLDMQVRSLTDAMYDLLKDTELGRHWITGQPLPHDPDPDALRTGDGD